MNIAVVNNKYNPNRLCDLWKVRKSPTTPEIIGPTNSPNEIAALNNPEVRDRHLSWCIFSNFSFKIVVMKGSTYM
jgi:hypothetical protein